VLESVQSVRSFLLPLYRITFSLITSFQPAVLTKPDRIAEGEQSSWLRLLKNEQERFKHGWHCVKQSDQHQLDSGITWAEGRKNEAIFFETTAPWSSLDESVRSRLGTQFLTEALGGILFELICNRYVVN
jgi:Dynamin central region